MRIVSALTTLALVAGAAGAASVASIASANTPQVTTQAATGITTSGGTLNALNGSSDATGSAFWVATSSATLSGLASSSSPTLSAGAYSTGDLGAVASSSAFSAPLSGATIPAGLSLSSNTTYYYVAWVNVGGVWYPGSEMSFTTLASTTPTTTISNIQVANVGTSSATVSWNTNNACTGTVNYGTTSAYGSSANTTGGASTTQSVTINNLNAGTVYHFGITANCATTTSTDQTFTTASSGTSTPLAVTGVDALRTTGIADNSYSDGWEWVMHVTVPNNEDAFHIAFTNWAMNGSPSTTFPTGGNVEVYSAQSSNATSTGSALTNASNAYGGWLYLNGDKDGNSANGRQIDVHILVKIPTGTAAGSYSTTYTAQSWPSSATSTASTTP